MQGCNVNPLAPSARPETPPFSLKSADKVFDGVTYERDGTSVRCSACVCAASDDLCDALAEPRCSLDYNFKVKDITKSLVQGVKYDDGKTLYSLVPPYALEAVAKNLTAGLKKYPARNNWMQVDKAEERYLDALYRHLEAHRRGEIYDTDNIDPTTTHLSAVAVNAMFLLELMLNPELKGKDNGTI